MNRCGVECTGVFKRCNVVQLRCLEGECRCGAAALRVTVMDSKV